MTPLAAWTECLGLEGIREDPPLRGGALLARWNEPHRHYHTPVHLQACLDWWERLHGCMRSPGPAGLALLYHDAVYDPLASDNETASARLARMDLMALGMAEPRIAEVEALILATDHRRRAEHPDAAVVIDIDLAILGTGEAAYLDYVAQVRGEYGHVDAAGWKAGRARVLESFLARPRIFTSGLLDDLEGPARRNLRQELDGIS